MNRDTIEALNRLNREFYERHAGAFQAKRSQPWPGWERVLELFQSSGRREEGGSLREAHVPNILDAGCGHGRFAKFLEERLTGPLDYLGIDSSGALLEKAATRLRDTQHRHWRFAQADLLADKGSFEVSANDLAHRPLEVDREPSEPDKADVGLPPGGLKRTGAAGGGTVLRRQEAAPRRPRSGGPSETPTQQSTPSFDLIVALGLLHHLPALSERRHLLQRLAARLARDGTMALSFWQFGGRPRFERRVIPWREHNRRAAEPIDPAELEDGDTLLAWGEIGEAGAALLEAPRRYCHFASPAEARSLAAALELDVIDEFLADGRDGDLNLYLVLRRG